MSISPHLLRAGEFLKKQAPATYIGVIGLGLIGSLIYDTLVKPGLSTFGKLLLNAITFGSQTINDWAYQSAAMDPSILPSFFVLLFIISLTVGWFPFIDGYRQGERTAKNEARKLKPKLATMSDEDLEAAIRKSERRLLKHRVKMHIANFILALFLVMAFNVLNQSILIWRTFHNQLKVITPYIPQEQVLLIQSKFAQVRKKSDYKPIEAQIRSIADAHQIHLDQVELW